MPRRVSLPGAAELFRTTQDEKHAGEITPGLPDQPPDKRAVQEPAAKESAAEKKAAEKKTETRARTSAPKARGSGRVRHDEKITVYVSGDELLALEQARLTLRAEHGMAIDRGRIVREAISAAIEGLNRDGADSELIRRLSQP